MQAIHIVFSDRSNALLTVQTLLSNLSSMNVSAKKLSVSSSIIFGGDKTRNHKIEELKDTIKVTEDARDYAVKEYECIKVFLFHLKCHFLTQCIDLIFLKVLLADVL